VLIALIAGGVVWLGFVCHTSPGPRELFGKYSKSYFTFLGIITLGWAGLCLWAWRLRESPERLRGIAAAMGVAVAGALVLGPWVYIIFHQRYLAAKIFSPLDRRAHSFYQIDESPPLPASSVHADERVLCLGGSTTYGAGLDRSEAYPAVLEELLNADSRGRRWVVHNAGVGWHTSMHSLLRYVGEFAQWRPRVVIDMQAFNDIYQASEGRLTTGAFRDDYGHFFGALGLRVNPRDRFNQDLYDAAGSWFSDFRPAPPTPSRTVDLLRALPSFRRNLTELVRRASQDGALVVLVSEPFSYRDAMPREEQASLFYRYYYEDYAAVPSISAQAAAMRAFNAAARAVAQETGAVFVDAEAALPKTKEYLFDDVHFTAAGARVVAETIFHGTPWPLPR